MAPRPRDETSFPAIGNTSSSSHATSERMGAFGEMSHSPNQRMRVQMPQPMQQIPRAPLGPQPSTASSPMRVDLSTAPPSRQTTNSSSFGSRSRPQPQSREPLMPATPVKLPQVNLNTTNPAVVYLSTTHTDSNADSTDSRRRHDKLSDVYSMSGDTVEFARNLSDYINERIPYQLSIGLLLLFSLIAFLFILCGTLNFPFCPLQPMIPIWLALAGVLFIISATFRIYFLIPQPPRSPMRRRQRKLGAGLLCKGIELLFALANIVWLILGCVWVYGGRQYVHFEEGMFERHYCEPIVYWTAFVACTTFLLLYCFVIIALICLLAVGSMKESARTENSNPLLAR
ncbi:unnamed protein product [Caenorhabditis auriculariae]|uniref:Uncharacterized protein n=1 Tax=Caenorhabditis auriculariae TaxID=2777116 RepID=A0A8S1HT86_9PELO|nr:unnamed protein product [Caenorhabditis auriculariae]